MLGALCAPVPGLAAQDTAPVYDTLGDARIRVAHLAENAGLAQRIYLQASRLSALPGLPSDLPTKAIIAIAPNEAAFTELVGGRVPEWGAAVAIPSEHKIVVPGFASNRSRGFDEGRVLAHEWAHLGLHEYLNELQVPRWFSEGYAEWTSGGWNAAEGWRLRLALALHQTPPLDSLGLSWPAHRGEAEIAYLLSATAVEYLASESGVVGLERFLETWRAEASFETAFRRTYGVTSGQFEEDWKAFVRKRYGWLLILSESLVFWGFLGVILSGLWWIRRRVTRERMAKLRASEPPPAPAYWDAVEGSNPLPGAGYFSSQEGRVGGVRPSTDRPIVTDPGQELGRNPVPEDPQE